MPRPSKRAKLLLTNLSSCESTLSRAPSSYAPPGCLQDVSMFSERPAEQYGPIRTPVMVSTDIPTIPCYITGATSETSENEPRIDTSIPTQSFSQVTETIGDCIQVESFWNRLNASANLKSESIPDSLPQVQPNIDPIIPGNGLGSMPWSNFLSVPAMYDLDNQAEEILPSGISSPVEFWTSEASDAAAEPVHIEQCISADTIPLYDACKKSKLSLQDGLVSILTFASSVHLSGSDLVQLLDLMHLLYPSSNLPTSKHLFFSYLKTETTPLNISYYCDVCWKKRQHSRDVCQCKNSKVKYFITCSVKAQLTKILNRPDIKAKLKHRFSRVKLNPENIEDIYDTNVYKEAEKHFLSDPNNISLTWYTDGISIYECSSYSLWPFVFVINELPLDIRFRPENLILGGLWGDCEKPHPNVFILPLYQEMANLFTEGFSVDNEIVRVCVLSGTCDTPAKSTFMNMKGHAGYESCPKCFVVGEKTERTSNVMVFPHQSVLTLRNAGNYKECLETCIATKKECKGVHGPTVLAYMTLSDFIDSIAIDSMHCVFTGVTKQFLNLWFNPKFSACSFSVSDKTTEVNNALKNLKVPHFVQRLPEDVTKLSFWKASLCRNFLLYFALPVMKPFLKPEYFKNLQMLVEGISYLNKQSIPLCDFALSDSMLTECCKHFERLYGIRHMSFNFHLLRHLPKSVLDTGNLFITGCYKWEDLNGKMARLAHGTRHATQQVVSNFSILTDLPRLVSKLDSPEAKEYCEKVLKKKIKLCA